MKKSIINNGGVVRVGVFGLYYPHYRFGVFRRLHNMKEYSFVFHGACNAPGSFLKTHSVDVEFAFVNIRTKRLKLPIIGKTITLQPYAVWSMLTGEFDVYIMACDFLRPSVWCNILLSRLLKRKVCLWGQGVSRPATKLSWVLRGLIFKLAHSVIFYTEGVRQKWIERGFSEKKLFVAYNALDTDVSQSIEKKLTKSDLYKFASDCSLESKNVILFCGRLMYNWKRPDILIRAMKDVLACIPNAHIVIVGDGPQKKELQELVSDLSLDSNVSFAGAIYEEECLAKYFLISKVVVAPAAAGLIVQHAFGYGRPIIVSDDSNSNGPEVELVVDNVTGVICPKEDVSAFARAICKLLQNEGLRKQMSKNAFKVIAKKYNVENMAKGIIAAIDYSVKK